jgi:hypothetical protein
MKKGSKKERHYRVVGVGIACLAIFAFCGVIKAENVITANLTVSPALNVKPGTVLKFQADVIYNSKFSEPAGTTMRVFVTRSDFSWVSDKLDIQYPGMGSVHVNFNNGFAIPANAKNGQIFDFYLVYGPWYVLSNKASVKILFIKKILKQRI